MEDIITGAYKKLSKYAKKTFLFRDKPNPKRVGNCIVPKGISVHDTPRRQRPGSGIKEREPGIC
jgi:hypothetical protein